MAAHKFIDRYEILDVLGRGAMGAVYRAWDPKLRREVAIKVVASAQATGEKGRERFHREVCAIAALRHPNIVEIYDFSGMESEHLYYVMEKLDGCDLFTILRSKGPMPEAVVAAIGHEVCLALGVTHDAGIIHRDIKPENVFLIPSGRVVLTDYGVVKAVREDSAVGGFNKHTEIIGTPGFMAPELLASKTLGAYTDVFALGALLYNILTDRLPYEGNSPVDLHRAILAGKYVDPRSFDGRFSEKLCAVLATSLDSKPKKRFQSAAEMRAALKDVLDSQGVTDLRDDLREYAKDATAYTQAARARASDHLVEKLKVAVKDKDGLAARELHDRLMLIDPDNGEVGAITGLYDIARVKASGGSASAQPRPSIPFAEPDGWSQSGLVVEEGRGKRLLVTVVVGVVAVATGVLGFSFWRSPAKVRAHPAAPPAAAAAVTPPAPPVAPKNPTEAGGQAATPASSSPAASAAKADPDEGAELQIRLRGGQAMVTVDGQRLRAFELKGKRLSPGPHKVEVTNKKKRLALDVVMPQSGVMIVTADLKRGQLMVGE